jgi:uncharacterized protein (TIGR02996 family)
MNTEQSLLEVIIEKPEDDTPRLQFASWLEAQNDPRGEFIRVQCEIARHEREDPYDTLLPNFLLRRRQEALLRSYRHLWLAPLSHLHLHLAKDYFEFHRGMIEEGCNC